MKKDKKDTSKNQEDDRFEETKHILNQAAKKDWSLPEKSLMDRVTAAFQRKKSRLEERPSLSAALQFDNWAQPAALGMRGNGLRERQLLFSEGEFDLDLQIVKDRDSHAVIVRGQLLPVNDLEFDELALEGIELHMIDDEGAESRRLTDEFGRFHFSNCLPGDYTLRVILEDHDIILKSLAIKA